MRSRLRAVSPGRTERLGELLEAVEAASADLSSGEVLEAIGRAGRLERSNYPAYPSRSRPAASSSKPFAGSTRITRAVAG